MLAALTFGCVSTAQSGLHMEIIKAGIRPAGNGLNAGFHFTSNKANTARTPH